MGLPERRDIAALSENVSAGSVLMTLVRVSGSTDRIPGARLLALADGRFAGTISNRSLEADFVQKSTGKIRDGAVVEHFSSSGDDIDILLEAADGPEAIALLDALRDSLQGESSLIVTVLPQDGKRFGRIVIHEDGNVSFASDHIDTDDVVDLRAFARQHLNAHATDTTHCFRHVFLERFTALPTYIDTLEDLALFRTSH